MPTRTDTIIPEKITQVKALLNANLSLRSVARHTGVSYYTVWAISQVKYDSSEPLQPQMFKGRDYITGFKL